jgi:hypothetical protein
MVRRVDSRSIACLNLLHFLITIEAGAWMKNAYGGEKNHGPIKVIKRVERFSFRGMGGGEWDWTLFRAALQT